MAEAQGEAHDGPLFCARAETYNGSIPVNKTGVLAILIPVSATRVFHACREFSGKEGATI